jgi:hypothetical protein
MVRATCIPTCANDGYNFFYSIIQAGYRQAVAVSKRGSGTIFFAGMQNELNPAAGRKSLQDDDTRILP